MRPRKLTEEAVAYILEVEAARKAIPTRAAVAKKLGVSKNLVDQIAVGRRSYRPRQNTTKLDNVLFELGLAKP